MYEWQFISFVAMINIIDYFIEKSFKREIFVKFSCALALFPIVRVFHLPWALPLGGCPMSLG